MQPAIALTVWVRPWLPSAVEMLSEIPVKASLRCWKAN
jgi:hypothetical protein